MKQALIDTQQTHIELGKTKSIPRTSVGLRSANSIQWGKEKRDNPGRGKHNPKQQGKGLNQDTQARMKTGTTTTMTTTTTTTT